MTTPSTPPPPGDMTISHDESGLDEIKSITQEMRYLQDLVSQKSKRRREVVLGLRDHRVTYRKLAEAMGVSEVTVYKVIRGEGQ